MGLRTYLAIVQAPGGYPAPGEALDPAPPEGPQPPVLHTCVRLEEHQEIVRGLLGDLAKMTAARDALAGTTDRLIRERDAALTEANQARDDLEAARRDRRRGFRRG